MREFINLFESLDYQRVIPRDLFNEANLLKCYGKLFICVEHLQGMGIELEYDGGPFHVIENENGETSLANVVLVVHGKPVELYRPINSREPWPLAVAPNESFPDLEYFDVFDDSGNLSAEMKEFIGMVVDA